MQALEGWGETLSRSYGRCFAEFLNEGSPVRLGLLALSTCVGLRYGYYYLNLRSFSWHSAHLCFPDLKPEFQKYLEFNV